VKRRGASPYAVRLPNPGKHLYPPPLTELSAAQFRHLLAGPPARGTRAQLYLHLPFCESICTFCPIHKYQLTSSTPVGEYVEALKLELRTLSKLPLVQQLRFDNVYLGGGTPSVIPDRDLGELMDVVYDSFALESPQITFEGHVKSLTREKIRFVRSLGFNRMSTGVQTFDARLRRMLNLTPTEDDIRRCVENARERGFADFNIDLMFNLPGQDLATWEDDLRKAVSLDPAGIDVYETVIASRTSLYERVKSGEVEVAIDPERQIASYRLAEDFLAAQGYRQKNLFVWDRPGFENRLVGLQGELRDCALHILGTGLSAYSLIDGRPFMNEARRSAYVARVHETGHGVKTYHECSEREEMERFMIMSLEEFRLDRDRFAAIFARSMDDVFGPQLDSFTTRGLVEAESSGYRLTPLGRAWASTMAVEFYGGPVFEEILRAVIEKRFFGGITREQEYELPVFAAFHPELLLKDWWNLRLIVSYLRFLHASDRRWLSGIARMFAGARSRYGWPAWPWFASRTLRRIVGTRRPRLA
jgi:coproporphyrinogen III oxidase-like Fe-S oxidoreductase